MKYILDFDDVIFDTKTLKAKIEDLGLDVTKRSPQLIQDIKDADPNFDFKSLVFPNARAFLEESGTDCFILSSASSPTDNQEEGDFQREKIQLAGMGELLPAANIRVVSHSKKMELQSLKAAFDEQEEDYLFVDDKPEYLKEAKDLGITSIWMDRKQEGVRHSPEGAPTMLEFQRVGNFVELRAWCNNQTREAKE